MKSKRKESSALICGSFDPITRGHLDIVERAGEIFDKVYLVAFINAEKEYLFSTDERLSFMKKATSHVKNVICDESSGMVYEYVIKNGIDCIVKGIRNERDLSYEGEMARFNKEHSKRDTLFFFAREDLHDVSSTAVRDALKKGENVSLLLPDGIAEEVQKTYKSKS